MKIISGAGVETASLDTVESIKMGRVKLSQDEHLRYDNFTGREIDPQIPGFNSRIILIET